MLTSAPELFTYICMKDNHSFDKNISVGSILLVDGRENKPEWAVEFSEIAKDVDTIICGEKLIPMRYIDNTADVPRAQELYRITFADAAMGLENEDGKPSIEIVEYCMKMCGVTAKIGSDDHSTLYNEDGTIQELPVTILGY